VKRFLPLLALCLVLPHARAEKWQMQYFYDEERTSLTISDLAFPTAQRGVAVGYIGEKDRDRPRGTAVVTSDGGAHWALVPLPDPAISVYFLNDTLGWIVTTRDILQTDEGGRSWRKLPKSPKDILRVWFLDAERGYAVGLRKSAWETKDGGKTWTRLPAAEELKSSPRNTIFTGIAFMGPVGIITGYSRTPRYGDDTFLPDWMEPEKAGKRREWPGLSISIETRSRGLKWSSSTAALFGEISRLRLSPDGRALGLVEFQHSFPYPGEVFAFNWHDGKSERVFRDKTRIATDAGFVENGPAFLAAVAVPGTVLRAPIPGRLHILRSDDMRAWNDMEVDYRANARRAVMAAVDARNAWVATDSGMILKLVP
jgi:hypothetical protein